MANDVVGLGWCSGPRVVVAGVVSWRAGTEPSSSDREAGVTGVCGGRGTGECP